MYIDSSAFDWCVKTTMGNWTFQTYYSKTIKIGQQYVGPSFSYNPHYSFVAKPIASLPKLDTFSHTLLLPVALVCCFLCGLIHCEADVTVWKSSSVGVYEWYWVQFTRCLGGRSSPKRLDEFSLSGHHLAERPAPTDTVSKMLSSHY